MKKSDIQELYKQVKRNRQKSRKNTDLFEKQQQSGCKSCGRVTWKPNQ